jgi:hypothetical protein
LRTHAEDLVSRLYIAVGYIDPRDRGEPRVLAAKSRA